ncbi:hypothetical protein NMG60_11015350 [Bertholletia excelsa]
MGVQGGVADPDRRRPGSPVNKSSIFYRMIGPSVIRDKKLRIPGKVAKKLGHELPAVAALTTPNGYVWQVELKKIDDEVWFINGWHEFVEHQSIHAGYLLAFTYVGNLNFSVNVYNLAPAEIKYQCNTMSSTGGLNYGSTLPIPYEEEAEDDDSVESLDLHTHSQTPTSPENLSSSNYKANGGNLHSVRSTRDIGIQCSYGELMTSAYEIRFNSLVQRPEISRKRKRGTGPSKNGTEVQEAGPGTSGALLRRWRVITAEEKERVLNAAKMFQSENPFCRVILRRSYVYKGIGLHMPSSFAEKYLSGVTGFITLQVSGGEKWPVRCTWRDGSAKLSKGWPEFVWDNKLDEGDVCVFELIKMEEVVLRVTVFRAVEDAEPVNQFPKEHPGRAVQLAAGYDLNG